MNSRRSGWKLTLPPPHGQSPAIARTNVLLPGPDSPATSSRPPASITTSAPHRPDSRDRTPQCVFTGAEFSGHQQPLAGFDDHFRLADHGSAVVEGYGEIVETEDSVAFGLTVLDAAGAVAPFR